MDYVYHWASPLGGMLMAGDGEALTGLWFEGQKYFSATLSEAHEERLTPVFEGTIRWLETYFSGAATDFTPSMSPKGTPFRRAVWDVLLTIPFGQTMTYGEIAAIIAAKRGLAHLSPQAVGGAVGHNPISIIIPCHRVLGANGSLTGYAGGIERKRWLLEMEGSGEHGRAPDL